MRWLRPGGEFPDPRALCLWSWKRQIIANRHLYEVWQILRFIDCFYESEGPESGRLRSSKLRNGRGRRRLLQVRFENLATRRNGSITCPLVLGHANGSLLRMMSFYSSVADVVGLNNASPWPNFMENFPIKYSFTMLFYIGQQWGTIYLLIGLPFP